MTDYIQKIKERTPFKMFIILDEYDEYKREAKSNTLPIAIRGRSNLPNLKWAISALQNYRNGTVKKAIFYENGLEFGTFENGRYYGKYQTFE